jgi:hypothetical protein
MPSTKLTQSAARRWQETNASIRIVPGAFHERTNHCRSQTGNYRVGTGQLLVVPLRPIAEPTLVRWFPQGYGLFSGRSHHHGKTQLRIMPMQAFGKIPLL